MSDIHNLSVIEPPVRLYFSGHEQNVPFPCLRSRDMAPLSAALCAFGNGYLSK